MSEASNPRGGASKTAVLRCAICRHEFDSRDRMVDHLEGAHSVVTNVIERNTIEVDD